MAQKASTGDSGALWTPLLTYMRLMGLLLLVFVFIYFETYSWLYEVLMHIPTFAFDQPPRFYVVTTGTASLLSFLILIFEYWYYVRNGVSFIEQLSLAINNELDVDQKEKDGMDCDTRVANNPMNLFRGAEYERYHAVTKRKALTYYDMCRSAHDQSSWFVCDSDFELEEGKLMIQAWRAQLEEARIEGAKSALQINPNYPSALILLAEEEAESVHEAEKYLLRALTGAEKNYAKSSKVYSDSNHKRGKSEMKRDQTVLVYVKRRLAMCARKLGRVKEAAKIFKELTKETKEDSSNLHWLNSGENLIECYLEMCDYANAQATLAKYDDIKLPKSATICYTKALLMARLVSEKFSADVAVRRGPTDRELAAIEAIHRAVEFNPHVPAYLLEQKSLILPPEHILKRGDSEAVAYAFHHLKHWKQVEGALNVLHSTWEGTFRCIPYPLEKGLLFFPYPANTESADRELLPVHHEVSVFPKRELPLFIVFSAFLFVITAALAILTHQYPDYMKSWVEWALEVVSSWLSVFSWPSNSFWLSMSEWKVFGVPPWLAQKAWGPA